MPDQPVSTLKTTLKRGALLVAANWQVVVVQFVAESIFKILLTIPVLGAAFLVVLIVGGDIVDLLTGGLRDILTTGTEALADQPAALGAFGIGLALVLLGGSTLTFVAKAGTVSTLVTAERAAGPIERPPLRLTALRRAAQFSIEGFLEGCARFGRRYVVLGLGLVVMYGISGGVYLLVVFSAYRVLHESSLLLGWTLVTALCSSVLIVWITIVNLLYLLTQIAIAADDRGVRAAIRHVARFLRADLRDVAGIFGVVLVLVVLATVVSIVATTGLGLIAFVPLAGLIVLPLQAAAWLLRGLIFQYLGLAALGAYVKLYQQSSTESPRQIERPQGPVGVEAPTVSRTA